MECISPISLKDPTKRNAAQRNVVPCGKCGACLADRRNGWTLRLTEEQKDSMNAWFITLTYSEENLPWTDYGPTLVKNDLVKFIRKLRDLNKRLWKHKMKYFAIGEYGTKYGRPHYHVIAFNVHPVIEKIVEKLWGLGITEMEPPRKGAIHYCTKYHITANSYGQKSKYRVPEFAQMSKGLGLGYVKRASNYHLDSGNVYIMGKGGIKHGMPRYWKEKIFSEEARELLREDAMIEGEKQYWRKFNKLLTMGVKDPDEAMERQRIQAAMKVKKKNTKNDRF